MSRTRITVEGTGELLHEGPTVVPQSLEEKLRGEPRPIDAILYPRSQAEIDQEAGAEAAKRLGGGPIVREQQRQVRRFFNGTKSRPVS